MDLRPHAPEPCLQAWECDAPSLSIGYCRPFTVHACSAESSPEQVVQEFLLITSLVEGISDRWELQRKDIRLTGKKIFAPANLRATAENDAYAQLIQHWMSSKYTLRYTGGMVPDIHHILAKVCRLCPP